MYREKLSGKFEYPLGYPVTVLLTKVLKHTGKIQCNSIWLLAYFMG